jgi:hypothetical protein
MSDLFATIRGNIEATTNSSDPIFAEDDMDHFRDIFPISLACGWWNQSVE